MSSIRREIEVGITKLVPTKKAIKERPEVFYEGQVLVVEEIHGTYPYMIAQLRDVTIDCVILDHTWAINPYNCRDEWFKDYVEDPKVEYELDRLETLIF